MASRRAMRLRASRLTRFAEAEIHFVGGSETVDVGEKFGGEGFGLHDGKSRSETVGVVGAERRARGSVRGTMVLVDQHVTAVAFWADVLAMVIDGGAN